MCGRRLKQRRLLKPAFLSGLKYWGLGKQVCVYAARDLTPRSRDITWYSENLLGEFGEMGGRAMAPLSLLQVHTQRKTRWLPMGHFFTKTLIFANIFVQYKGIAQCFFSTKVRAKLLENNTELGPHFYKITA